MAWLSEVKMVTLGVRDLARSIAFYQAALGYSLQATGNISPAQATLLRSATSNPGRYAVMAADDSGLGRIRLVSYGPGPSLWNEQNVLTAVGYYALNFRVKDAKKMLHRVRDAGGKSSHEPQFWEVNESVAVWDSISTDPDGIRLDMFSYERGGELRGPLKTDVSVLQTIALATKNMRRGVAFYQSIGFQTLFDRVLDFPGLQDLLGTDQPVRIHNVNLQKDGHIVPGRVEFFEYLDQPADVSENLHVQSCPPAIGILSMSFVCTDLEQALAGLSHSGAKFCRRVAGQIAGFGVAQAALLNGPDGEAIELIER
jgi:catechol 2,3-dioxygenase-like lactoylglutathione lyase family enzyme